MSVTICTTIADLQAALAPHRRGGATIGLVPTMGALHEGHLSLVRRARVQNDVVVVSIFVNPTQFGPHEDLARYPRVPEQDKALLAQEGADLVFMPAAAEMYPAGSTTRVDVGPLAAILEGATRPGHFSGVATIVSKLFNLVGPTRAYFGQKDAQQVAVIRRFVRDLNMPVEIVVEPTIREPDGLAMSSRNRYLSADERAAAVVLSGALTAARDAYLDGERDPARLRAIMVERVAAQQPVHLDYAEVVDDSTWEAPPLATASSLLLIAVQIGRTRLIDNMPLRAAEPDLAGGRSDAATQ